MGKIITTPFAALLRLMYSISGSYGLSIILFSLIVTLIMVPFQMKSKRSMVRMGKLSDKQTELQKPRISRNTRRSWPSSTRRRASTPWADACGPSCRCL